LKVCTVDSITAAAQGGFGVDVPCGGGVCYQLGHDHP
jgi:hypothetical protein